MATASLAIGLLVCLPMGPVAIGLGIAALRKPSYQGGARSGFGIAWAGIVLGIVGTVGWGAWLLS